MGFENRIYDDGDIEFDIPEWKKNIEEIEKISKPINFLEEESQDRLLNKKEVGLKNLQSDSFIRIQDNGTIEAFTSYNSGIRMFRDGGVQIFGDKIQMIAKELDIITTANGTTINQNIIGKDVLNKFPRKKGKEKTFLELIKEYNLNTNELEDTK